MKYLIFPLLVFLAGCKSNTTLEVAKVKSTSAVNTSNCDADFDVFFRTFASDSIFQKKHFDFPVMEYHSDEDFPLDLMEDQISEESYVFTDFTKDKTIYDIAVEKKKDSVIYIRRLRDIHHLPMIYKFIQKNNCWMLVEFRDLTD